MSSMRNAVQRRNHKERAQPLERQKWGILEKHKDYSLRAKDFNEKKKRLKILREKAAERNPDEFSFGMMSSRTEGGRKITDRGNKALSEEVVKLLKTQDVGYIRTMLQQVRKEREKLEQGVILDDQEAAEVFKGKQGKGRKGHTVFVEDQEEQKKFKPDEWFGVAGEDVDRVWNRRRVGGADQKRDDKDEEDEEDEPKPKGRVSKKKEEAALQAWKEERAMQKKRERMQELRRARLEAVKERERELRTAEEALELQRAKMSHSIGGVNKNGVKFKIRERKR